MADLPQTVSDAQRAFIAAAEALGATQPATARPLQELPRLSSRELDALVESGLVREAADWRYYVYRPRRAVEASFALPAPASPDVTLGSRASRTPGRYVRTFIFWLIVVLIPILLLRLAARP